MRRFFREIHAEMIKMKHTFLIPCPFSPYSDVNVKDTSLREALHSSLFMKLQSSGTLMEDHAGGCVLYENRDVVERYLM